MQSRITRWGNSLAVRIPKAFAEDAGLGDGAEIDIRLDGGSIVITPRSRGYGLAELVDRITEENRHGETDWGRPAGNEVW